METEQTSGDGKMTREHILTNEPALLQGLMRAGTQVVNADNAATIEIARNGELLFAFKVRPMTDPEFQQCNEKATKYKMEGGIRVPVDYNRGRFHALAIHKATLPPDGSSVKVWDHKEMWEQFGVLSGVDLIDKVLLAGEKSRAYDILEKISGYKAQDKLEETAGE